MNKQKTRVSLDKRFYPVKIDGRMVEVPSVTTVIDHVRSMTFLDKWEHEMHELLGVDGFKKYMSKKAFEGTTVHNLIELYLTRVQNGDKTEIEWTDDIPDVCWKKFLNFVDWYTTEKPKKIEWLERVVFSEENYYAGRADACIDGYLHDWKTSKNCFDTHKMQASAYYKAYQEETGIELNGIRILSLGVETQKGWRVTEISGDKQHKMSNVGENEIDHYFRGFLYRKQVFDYEFPMFSSKTVEYPVFITPKSYA